MSDTPFVPPSFGPRQAQPLERALPDARAIVRGLFAEVDPQDLPIAARLALEKQKATQQAAARLFADPDFRTVLESLCDVTVRRPVTVVTPGVSAEFAALYAAKREGQNEIVYLLLAWIAEGRGEAAPTREPAS